MSSRVYVPTAACVAIVTLVSVARGVDNWPQWRGPAGSGVAAPGEYPVKFSADEAVAWKKKLPGVGCSTPAVWDDKVFLTAGAEGKDAACCYDFATGKLLWQKEFEAEVKGKHRNGSGSNPSPATDGEHVVVYFKSSTLACLDLAGEVTWEKNLGKEFGPIDLWWDLGNSPVIVDGKAVVAVVHGGESYLAAFDLETGKLTWRTPRQYERPPESDQSYASPQVVHLGDKDVIVVWGADHLTGHDAATGKLLWDFDGFNPKNEGMWRVIASPAIADGIAVVPYARGKMLAAFRMPTEEASGDLSANRLWQKQDLGADVPTPAIADGRLYLLADDGKVTCLKLDTGDEIWTAQLPKSRDKFYSSPIVAGDLLYCLREDGKLFVGRIGDDYTKLSENDMGEHIIATPIPIRGGLLIRGEENLIRIAPPSDAAVSQAGGN